MTTRENTMTTDLMAVLNHQRAAFYQKPLLSYVERLDLLNRLQKFLLNSKDELPAILSQDFGYRSSLETALEVFSVLTEIKYAKKNLKHWMRPQNKKVLLWYQFAAAKVFPQPLGVIGIISAWNAPINLTLSPLVSAIAAGNKVMIKVSETTPKTSYFLKNNLKKYFAEHEVYIVTGDNEVGHAFAKLPFNHLLFTGSTKVAHQIMKSASVNLTSVTLELGGKSPVILAPDIDIYDTAKKIMMVKLLNSGQLCLAPDYVLLPASMVNDFIVQCKKIVEHHFPDILNNENYTNIINPIHFKRLQNILLNAKNQGGNIIPLIDANPNEETTKLIPTIITDCKPTMTILQEEIFGPYLPLIPYEKLEDVIPFLNTQPKPLGLYFFSKNKNEIDFIIKNTFSGGVTINDIALHFTQPSLPFGGIGLSGMGIYHGEYGFNTFSQLKPVYYQSKVNLLSLFYPPYKKITKWLLTMMLR